MSRYIKKGYNTQADINREYKDRYQRNRLVQLKKDVENFATCMREISKEEIYNSFFLAKRVGIEYVQLSFKTKEEYEAYEKNLSEIRQYLFDLMMIKITYGSAIAIIMQWSLDRKED